MKTAMTHTTKYGTRCSRRFGVIDEEMYMKRRLDSRRQKDQEGIQEFEMALRTLYQVRGHTLQLNNVTQN